MAWPTLRLGSVDTVAVAGAAVLAHPFGRGFVGDWCNVEMIAVAINL